MNFHATGSNGMEGLAFLAILVSIAVTIFWMVVGWRAMRAHERIADSLEEVARQPVRDDHRP